jgi:hypothetical protein
MTNTVFEGKDLMFILRDDQQTEVHLKYRDAKDQPTTAENATLESSDPSIVSVEKLAANRFSIVAGNVGVAQIQATADARLGSGEVLITGTESIEVVAGEAAVMHLEFSEPTKVG